MRSGSILNGLATYIQHVDAHLIHHLGRHTRREGLMVGRHGGCVLASVDACRLTCLLIGCVF